MLPDHAVLIGDNNTGKSSVFEAIDLALGPDRLSRRPPVDEHDFYQGRYLPSLNPDAPEGAEPGPAPKITVEVTITNLSPEQEARFGANVEWLNTTTGDFYQEANPAGVDAAEIKAALRVTFVGQYDPDEDDFVGNSYFYYNNSLHGHFGQLAASGNTRVRGTSVTVSGSGLDWHDLPSLLRPNGLGRYSFVGDNEIRFNPPGRQFDTVVMMDCSQCPIHPQLKGAFHTAVKKNAELLNSHGIRPVLFMSWAYKDKPEMTQTLAAAYTEAAKANGAKVIPTGLAFARAIAARPDVELYAADKRHPSVAGTYLAACTTYATLVGRSPVGLAYTAGLQPALAVALQQAAWDTVQAYTQP